MLRKYLSLQSGITLMELLAVLAISSMIIGILSTVLITTYRNKDVTESHIKLRQEANLIVTTLRQAHENKEYKLCYEDDMLYLITDHTEPLSSSNLNFKGNEKGVLLEYKNNLDEGSLQQLKESVNISCNRPVEINTSGPLIVSLTLVDENDKTFEIKTAIDNLGQVDPSDPVPGDDDTGDEEPAPPAKYFVTRDEFASKITLVRADFTTRRMDPLQSEIIGNTEFAVRSYIGNWWLPLVPQTFQVVDGSAYFSNGLTMSSPLLGKRELSVDRDLFINNNAEINNNNTLMVKGNARISSLTLASSRFDLEGNLFVEEGKAVLNGNGANLSVSGSARMDRGLTVESGNTVYVENHLFIGRELSLRSGSTVIVNGNLYMDLGTIPLIPDNAELIVNGGIYYAGIRVK